jgi:hypothetical protein
MAPNFKLMAFTMSVAIGSKWLLDTEDPGERRSAAVAADFGLTVVSLGVLAEQCRRGRSAARTCCRRW